MVFSVKTPFQQIKKFLSNLRFSELCVFFENTQFRKKLRFDRISTFLESGVSKKAPDFVILEFL